MTPFSSKRLGEHGFTLVEVMIALLIFGMIAAAGVAVLAFSVRAQGMTTQRLDDTAAIGRVGALLTADLAQAVDRPARDEGGVRRPAFVGTGSALTLVRGGWSNLDAAPRSSLQKVQYRLAGDVLERTAWPMLDGATALQPAALLTGVRAIALRYRIAGAWSDRWDGREGAPLPAAVELTIERRDGMRIRELFLTGAGTAPPPQPQAAPDAP